MQACAKATPTLVELRTCKIQVYAGDHAPPHFKIFGPGSNANVRISDLEVIAGRASRNALAEARDWARSNRDKLQKEWDRLNLPTPPKARR